MKKCSKCLELLPFTAFHRESRSPDGYHAWCQRCANVYRRDRYKKYPKYRATIRARNKKNYEADRKKHASRVRIAELRRKYGISWEQYQAVLTAQSGICGLCESTSPGGRGQWHLDHCHDSGRMRGILCHNCNTSLGIYEKLKTKIGLEVVEKWIAGGHDAVRLRKVA